VRDFECDLAAFLLLRGVRIIREGKEDKYHDPPGRDPKARAGARMMVTAARTRRGAAGI